MVAPHGAAARVGWPLVAPRCPRGRDGLRGRVLKRQNRSALARRPGQARPRRREPFRGGPDGGARLGRAERHRECAHGAGRGLEAQRRAESGCEAPGELEGTARAALCCAAEVAQRTLGQRHCALRVAQALLARPRLVDQRLGAGRCRVGQEHDRDARGKADHEVHRSCIPTRAHFVASRRRQCGDGSPLALDYGCDFGALNPQRDDGIPVQLDPGAGDARQRAEDAGRGGGAGVELHAGLRLRRRLGGLFSRRPPQDARVLGLAP
mmetsp:Transcript_14575/g.41251  ORF Transcript_14575/g.41251 Transcript_14575/m.41251 type:complete len:266 (+) Transcript_14575:96-893(+)